MINNKNAGYRKFNDGSHNSSTYHKKDGTNIRAILKHILLKDVNEILERESKKFLKGKNVNMDS